MASLPPVIGAPASRPARCPSPWGHDGHNGAVRRARSWAEARRIAIHPEFHRGYLDVLAGRPLDSRRLDGLSWIGQIRHENGREIAAETMAAGLRIMWPSRTRPPPPLRRFLTSRAGRGGGPAAGRRRPAGED